MCRRSRASRVSRASRESHPERHFQFINVFLVGCATISLLYVHSFARGVCGSTPSIEIQYFIGVSCDKGVTKLRDETIIVVLVADMRLYTLPC